MAVLSDYAGRSVVPYNSCAPRVRPASPRWMVVRPAQALQALPCVGCRSLCLCHVGWSGQSQPCPQSVLQVMLLLEAHQTSAHMPAAQVPGMSEGGKTSAWPCKAYKCHEQLPIAVPACL